jgi:hypothetical protein
MRIFFVDWLVISIEQNLASVGCCPLPVGIRKPARLACVLRTRSSHSNYSSLGF